MSSCKFSCGQTKLTGAAAAQSADIDRLDGHVELVAAIGGI